ncbi:mechanosensitive ion channel [Candidatus Bathyarchaeota archaeon]|nr:mechanosensitive ion channel [Candidatus Bathyarchaeota archaeon]
MYKSDTIQQGINQTILYDEILNTISNIDLINLIIISGQILVIGAAFLLLTNAINSLIDKVQERREIEQRVTRQIKLFSKYVMGTIGLLTILGILGINLTLIATSLGIAGIAVGFAARDLLSNLLSGVFILFDRTYQVNDAVLIHNTYGIVRLITLRNTEIKTFEGNIVVIPNSKVVDDKIINMTSGSSLMLSSISVRVSFDEDYKQIKEIMRNVAENHDDVMVNEFNPLKFRVEELEERLQGVEIEMYFTVQAINEPWIKGDIFEKVISSLMENEVKFHRQAPNNEPSYG